MRWKLKFIFLFLLIAIFTLPLTTSLRAQGDEITGVDILFIIDQSASMSGGEPGIPVNDPLNLRFYATQFAAEWLAGDHLRVHDDADYRMAVVHFGDRVQAQTFTSTGGSGHWQEISPDSYEDWTPLSSELETALGPDTFGGHMGWTLPLLGFEEAARLFNELPSDPNRRRAIVVLTDGLPFDEGESSTFYQAHFEDVKTFTRTNFPSPEYTIYTVAMNDSSRAYWPTGEPYWQDITGNRAEKVNTNDEVGVLFRRILLELTSDIATDVRYTDVEIEPGEVVIPPYLESVAFTFFLSDPNDVPELTIDGVLVDPATASGATHIGAGTPIQAILVANPEPGRWFVEVTPADTTVNIVMRTIEAEGQLLQPVGAQSQYIPLQIQYRMVDSRGNPLREYADRRYDLFITATVKSGSEAWSIDLEKQADNSYQADFMPLLVGPHTIQVHAESEDVEGNKIQVYDGSIGAGFEVEPITFAAVDLPSNGRQYEQFSTTYEILDSRDRRVAEAVNLDAVIIVSSGSDTDEVALTRQTGGSYTADYTPTNNGAHTINILAEVIADDGQRYILADEESVRFDVLPTRRLSVHIIPPETLEQWDTELWFQRVPLMLEVEVTDDAGNRVDLNDAFVGSPATALAVSVQDKKENDYPDVLDPSMASQGLYAAETTELGIGEYAIAVQMDATLNEGFLFARQVDSITITRIRHPWHIPILTAIIAIIITLILLFIAWKRYRHSLQVHPAVGDIRIVNQHGSTRFRERLESFNRNRIKFNEKALNDTVHVTKLEIRCDSEDAHNSESVDVKVYLDGDKQPAVERTMRPGGEVKLGQYKLWLLKDPTDAQLDDRSEY